MKVMISQPMAGKSVEQVKEERQRVVERLTKMGHEVVDSVIAKEPPQTSHVALWYLGGALQIMSTCDAVLFMKGWDTARGCRIEHQAVLDYGLELMFESDLYPKRSQKGFAICS